MASDSSSQGGVAFDLNSQAGVLEVLTSIRKSELPNDVRSELRDLVFLFANGGGDAAVREMLEARLKEVGLTAPIAGAVKTDAKDDTADSTPAPEAQPEPQPQSGFAGGRPTPSFGANPKPTPVAAAPSSAPAPEPSATATPPQPVEPVKAATPPTPPPPEPQAAPAPEPAPLTPPPAPPAPSAPSVTTPPPVAAPEPTKPPVPPAPPAAPAPSTPAQPDLKDNDQLKRIREIKADVNSRVGNPVNLVDIDNTVGREYMNSLLEAMRAVSGGTPQGAASAMTRLESAYNSVVSLLEKQGGSAPAPEAASTTGYGAVSQPMTPPAPEPPAASVTPPVLPTEPATPPSPAPAPEPPQPAPPTPPAPPQAPEPVSRVVAPAPLPKEEEQKEEEKPSGWAQALAGIKLAVTSHDEPEHAEPKVTPPTQQTSQFQPASTPEPTPTPEPAQPAPAPSPAPAPTASPTKPLGVNAVRSVAQDPVPLRKPTDLPEKPPSALQSDHAGDPLYGSAVDEGLQQLLLEWSLFKKSGMFGTGPKGMEHPLFKQLAPLQIPLILAGRFEGATQEIKQSVTDYMNGWRYEQGIVYESGETFEHYLRRVIHHILGGNEK